MKIRLSLGVVATSLFCLTAATCPPAAHAQGLAPVELGAPAGAAAYLRDANDHNLAVGYAAYPDTDRAFVWQRTGFTFLPQPPNAFASRAYGLNKSGKIVGFVDLFDPKSGVFGSAAVLWEGSRLTFLPRPKGATDTTALRINERGQIVGWSFYEPGYGGQTGYQALLWEGEKVREITPPAGLVEARPVQINRSGVVAATATSLAEARPRAFLWREGVATLLPLPVGAVASEVNDLSDAGVAVGSVDFPEAAGGVRTVPAVWETGEVRLLPTLGGGFSQAVCLNRRGAIVGTSSTAEGTARLVLWEAGELVDLGPAELAPAAFNSRGAVFGTRFGAGGAATAFLLNTR